MPDSSDFSDTSAFEESESVEQHSTDMPEADSFFASNTTQNIRIPYDLRTIFYC